MEFRDDSELFLGYVKNILEKLSDNQAFIKQNYGEMLRETLWKEHESLIEKIIQCQKLAIRIIAKKI